MQVHVVNEAGYPVVVVAGEIGHENRDELLNTLSGLIARGASHIVIDMTQVPYLDSGGLSVIFTAIRRLPADGWVGALSPSPDLLRLFEICGLLTQARFRIFHTRQELERAAVARAG